FLESRGAQFSLAFPDAPVTLLYADDRGETGRGEWGWRVWTAQGARENAPPESFSEGVTRAQAGAGARLLARLTGGAAVGDGGLVRARAWARDGGRNLPLGRVPAATGKALPVIDYVTVAALDQKALLVEDGPRLYRLEWVEDGVPGG
ncbi:MAG TPA: hypothetical protein VM490_03965, partial [Armatimonadaceae bacterium]|nr:hypothetical protein [Armatimonadaceae bacterium]